MNIKIGKKFIISGMTIEIISDDVKRWETRNITTREIVFFDKLGKAEEIVE